MHELISTSDANISSVEYHDRYLFTPLTAALLTDVIGGLRETVGTDRWDVSVVKVTTTSDNNKQKSGRFVWDNWSDPTIRDSAIQSALDFNGIEGEVIPVDKLSSLHGRALTIAFSCGRILTVRLDQGVSYWRAVSTRQGLQPYFDFRESRASILGEQIAGLTIDLEASPYPTHVFTKVRG